MKATRSLFHLLASACLACVAAFDTYVIRASERLAGYRNAIVDTFKRVATHVVDVLAPQPAGDRAASVRIVQAKAFVQRLTRREGIQLTDGWRMCPSV